MMIYKIEFEKSAQKFLDKQDKKQRIRLLKAIYELPNGTDIKRLRGHELYRMRVGNYCVIYRRDDTVFTIMIEDIDNRGDVYKSY